MGERRQRKRKMEREKELMGHERWEGGRREKEKDGQRKGGREEVLERRTDNAVDTERFKK